MTPTPLYSTSWLLHSDQLSYQRPKPAAKAAERKLSLVGQPCRPSAQRHLVTFLRANLIFAITLFVVHGFRRVSAIGSLADKASCRVRQGNSGVVIVILDAKYLLRLFGLL